MYTYSTTVLVDLSQHHCFIVLDLSIPFNSLPLNGFFKVGLYTFSRHLSSSSPFIVFSRFPVVAAFNRHLNLFSWYRAFMSGVQTLDWALDNHHSRRWTMLVTMDCMYVWNGFYGHISLNFFFYSPKIISSMNSPFEQKIYIICRLIHYSRQPLWLWYFFHGILAVSLLLALFNSKHMYAVTIWSAIPPASTPNFSTDDFACRKISGRYDSRHAAQTTILIGS